MDDDDEEMYALALGEEYMPSGDTSSATVPVTGVEAQNQNQSSRQKQPNSSSAHTGLFRQLLVGSRSQITKLKGDNEKLKKDLKDALDSSGVVTCPNCMHHFKERHFPLRPRTMKKIKARNCVELEFNSSEELQSWLYLNQLETNNDGMPTVMDIKKPSKEKPCSLKTVGSLLPEFYDKKKKDDEKKKNEDLKKDKQVTVERNTEKDTKNIRSHEKQESRNPRQDQSKKPESRESRDKDRRKSMEVVRSGVTEVRKSRDDTNKDRKVNKEKPSRDSERNADEKHRKNRSNISDNNKRKLSPLKDESRDSKIQKRTISERIQFPGDKKVSPDSFDTIIKEISSTVEKTRKSSDQYSSSNGESSQTMKTKKQPIVWADSNPEIKANRSGVTTIPFEFKVKPMEKKISSSALPSVSAAKTDSEVGKTGALDSKTVSGDKVSTRPQLQQSASSKYKFVPTSKKICMPTVSQKHEDKTGSPTKKIPVGEVSIDRPNIKGERPSIQIATNSREIMKWKLMSIRKPATFFQRSQEVRVMWSEKMSNHNENCSLFENTSSRVIEHSTASSLQQSVNTQSNDPLLSNKTQIGINKINLEEVGISAEGIAMLQLLKSNNNPAKEHTGLNIRNLEDKSTANETDNSTKSALKTTFSAVSANEVSNTVSTTRLQNLSTSDAARKGAQKEAAEEEDDEFREFFPDLVIARQAPSTSSKVDSSRRQFSTGSFNSMMDREEDELQLLIREDSAVPPNGDCLNSSDQYLSDFTPKPEETKEPEVEQEIDQVTQKEDWEEFCLEDLDEEIDESTRERKISEMEKLGTTVEEDMEWTASQEDDQTNGDEEYDEPKEENHEDSQFAEIKDYDAESSPTRRPTSVPLEMDVDFRLSDDENAESPRTSTPSRSDIPDDLSASPGERNIEKQAPPDDDNFINELDWNYGTDYEDEDGENEEVIYGRGTSDGVDRTDDTENKTDQLEDGEISEEEEAESKVVKQEPKKPMRERIKYVVEERQIRHKSPEKSPERDRSRRHRSERERSRRSPDGRRSSGERYRHHKRRDSRPATYGSLLKRRN